MEQMAAGKRNAHVSRQEHPGKIGNVTCEINLCGVQQWMTGIWVPLCYDQNVLGSSHPKRHLVIIAYFNWLILIHNW